MTTRQQAIRRPQPIERNPGDLAPAAVEPWRRPIDTGLSRMLRIAREGRH